MASLVSGLEGHTHMVDASTNRVGRRGGQPPCRADHPRPGRGQGQPEREASNARKGQQSHAGATLAGRSAARKGGWLQGPAASPAANRGDGASRRGGRPLVGWLPAGKGSRRLCRGNDGDDGTEGETGVRASFGEKDDPALMNSENSKDCPR
ncbi:hypothetical protein BHE74_00028726, partial [Ensete ventricosum]